MQDESPQERTEAELAAREAASIGGDPGDQHRGDEAMHPVQEAGGGEAEGFEQAEELLVEHASHGDQQPAHAVLHDEVGGAAEPRGEAYGEADRERSSEREDEEPPAAQ
jgi:hypothetical protein